MRNNQTEYLLSLVEYALSKFQSGPARPVLRGIAESGAAFGADVRQYAAHPPKPAESIVKYHLDGNLRISRAISVRFICTRYRILALCQSRSSWRPTETRDDMFVGPGKQRISEGSLWWTVKRKDRMNNLIRLKFTQTNWPDSAGLRYRRGAEEQR
jgi:hypothetical protein